MLLKHENEVGALQLAASKRSQ